MTVLKTLLLKKAQITTWLFPCPITPPDSPPDSLAEYVFGLQFHQISSLQIKWNKRIVSPILVTRIFFISTGNNMRGQRYIKEDGTRLETNALAQTQALVVPPPPSWAKLCVWKALPTLILSCLSVLATNPFSIFIHELCPICKLLLDNYELRSAF